MRKSPFLYHDLLEIAAAIRAEGISARFVSVRAEGGEVSCSVTTGSNVAPGTTAYPHRARHPLHGAALHEAAAKLARELLQRRISDLSEIGGRGRVTISADGAVHLDLRLSNNLHIREDMDLKRLRMSAMSHGTNRAVCLAAALSDDARFPAWNASEQVQRNWMKAAQSIEPDAGPDHPGIGQAAVQIVVLFRPEGIGSRDLEDILRARLYPDVISPINPDEPVTKQPEGLGTAPAWLQLDPLEAERLHIALEASPDPVLSRVFSKLQLLLSDTSCDEAFRAAAVEKYASRLTDGDLDFQADGMVSKGEEGAYVMAFLWVRNAEAGLEDPDDEIDSEPAP